MALSYAFTVALLFLLLLQVLFPRCFKLILHAVSVYFRKQWLGRKIYGPPALPFIGNVHRMPDKPQGLSDYLREQVKLTNAAGEQVFRLFVLHNLVVVPISGEAVAPILDSSVELNKSGDYNFYREWLGDASLLMAPVDHWRILRKALAPFFHITQLRGYIGVFNRQSQHFVAQLLVKSQRAASRHHDNSSQSSSVEGKPVEGGASAVVDIHKMLCHCTLDIVAEATGLSLTPAAEEEGEGAASYGEEKQKGLPHQEDSSSISAYIKAVEAFNCYSYLYNFNPINWIPGVWQRFGYGRQTTEVVAILRSTSWRAIQEELTSMRRAADAGATASSGNSAEEKRPSTNTFIRSMLRGGDHGVGGKDSSSSSSAPTKAAKLTLEEIQAQVDALVFAGHDTSAQAVAWTLWSLATHPEIQERAHQEVVDVCGDAFSEEPVEEAQLPLLKYVERCIKEAMRCFPPVPIVQRRLLNDVEMGGKLVPAGTSIYVSSYAIHHNEKIYPNADRYDPDRFLEENSTQRHSYDYIPFSGGPRNCIGQKFAWMEMRILIAHILRRFRLSSELAFKDNHPDFVRRIQTTFRLNDISLAGCLI